MRRVQRGVVDALGDTVDEPPLLDRPPHRRDLVLGVREQVAAVRRSVEQWRFIDSVAERIDDAALREAQSRKDAVAAYELVYSALGAPAPVS